MKMEFTISQLKWSIITLLLVSTLFTTADDSKWRFTTTEQVISVGDIHGDFNAFVAIMQKANLLDSSNNWIGGKKHFVSTGDYLDRGPDSRKVMDLFIKLEKQADEAGGKFHVLLGNHEVMNLIGDRRYVAIEEYASYIEEDSASYRGQNYKKFLSFYGFDNTQKSKTKFDNLHPPGYFGLHALFKHNGYYGEWLKDKPFMIIINDQLFTHGGLSKIVGDLGLEGVNVGLINDMNSYAKLWYSFIEDGFFLHSFYTNDRISIANALLDGHTKNDKFLTKRFTKKVKRFLKFADSVVSKSQSPTWYRGTALCHQFSEQPLVHKVLKQLGASSAYLGHSVTASHEVESRFDKTIFLQDTGMFNAAYNGQASLVLHSADTVKVFDARHGIHDIKEQPPRIWNRPYDMTNAQLEDFLLTAKVIASKDVGLGVTDPVKLTLKKGKRKIYALFKNIDTHPHIESKSKWPRSGDSSDRYNHELAAYELNKILGLEIIPPTVARSFKGKKGIYQFWINNAINRSTMIKDKIAYEGSCSKKSQMDMMKIFDALIFNDDRNTGNVLFQRDEWQIWLIDHTRAFLTKLTLPKGLKWSKLTLSDNFRKRLAELDQQVLRTRLSKYLHKKQISSILQRRNNILKNL
ncbi:MAG: hypothetical protein ACI9N9_002199 [Enterobacterales bacterium]|jgi:hypothetical protein